MVMETIQVRLGEFWLKRIDKMVKEGIYSSRSDAVRSAVRQNLGGIDWAKQVGTIPNTGDSVKEIREIRKKLSKEIKSYKDIEKIQNSFK